MCRAFRDGLDTRVQDYARRSRAGTGLDGRPEVCRRLCGDRRLPAGAALDEALRYSGK